MLTNGTSLKFNSEHSELVLDYYDRNVAFRFTGLQLSNPGGLKYYYKLEGFDNEWQLTNSTQRTARYTNLLEGDYIFIVKASNEDGFVSEHPAQLSFTVKPPFVRSGLAYFIYFLLFVVLMYISYLILKAFYRKKKKYLQQILRLSRLKKLHNTSFSSLRTCRMSSGHLSLSLRYLWSRQSIIVDLTRNNFII